MFKIGEFSKLGKVTIETLRHYDAIGLLKPANVDPFTGYRYYSARQLVILNRVASLKELGLSLDEIVQVLQDDLTTDQLRGMLMMRQIRAERDLREARERLDRVLARLHYLNQEDSMPSYEVNVKSVDALTIAAIREVVPHIDQMPERCGAMFGTIAQWMGPNSVSFGPTMTRYFADEYTREQIDTECAFIIPDPSTIEGKSPESPITIRNLEATPQMAYSIVDGDFQNQVDGLTPAFNALARWIEDNGYEIVGPAREIFYGSPETKDLTAEIQYPVEKR